MRYALSMPEPHSHLFHVEVEVAHPGHAAEFVFPVWTPGSYLVREFARHVEQAAADDGAGRALPLERCDKHRFLVRGGGAERAVFRFRMYANELTVRTAHLDGTHAYLTPGSSSRATTTSSPTRPSRSAPIARSASPPSGSRTRSRCGGAR